MSRGLGALVIFMLLIPVGYPISMRELLSRYSFSAPAHAMNVTDYNDYMVDKDGNGVNDTLVIELTSNNAKGSYYFVASLIDMNRYVTNQSYMALEEGINRLNLTFSTFLLSQNQYNYSLRIFNSTYSTKFRKDRIPTNFYSYFEEGFKVTGLSDYQDEKALKVSVELNSTANGTFEAALFLSYNNSIIYSKENFTINSTPQNLTFSFGNATIMDSHYSGKFNISSIRIGGKALRIGSETSYYSYRDFAAGSYIIDFSDAGADTDSDGKYDLLEISANINASRADDYALKIALYDQLDNPIETKNRTMELTGGVTLLTVGINGSMIYSKRLNGPFIVKYAELHQNGTIADRVEDAYVTSNYNYNDFETPSFPDMGVKISSSDWHHYGIGNITMNVTFENIGNSHAFNIMTEIFDNFTFLRSNKTVLLGSGSGITYQIAFQNITDFELAAIADPANALDESNESNNIARLVVKMNKKPILADVNNVTANETDIITINLSASDQNNDALSYSINLSSFTKNSSLFIWHTGTIDNGNYTIKAAVSDGYLNDSKIFHIVILDAPEKDADNDGINDSIDNVIGDERSVNVSRINLSIHLDSSRNLSVIHNGSKRVRFSDGNFIIAEFDFNLSKYKLNLTNLTIKRQPENSTGSLIFSGLNLPDGTTKNLYLDRINESLNGVCIKNSEVLILSEISTNCDGPNEFKIECDGTEQSSYACIYNATIGKYKIEGLSHSGVMQFSYSKPAISASQVSASSSVSTAGGGSGIEPCDSGWQCTEWSECIDGLMTRKCIDTSQCAFQGKKPSESEQCNASVKENQGESTNGNQENPEVHEKENKTLLSGPAGISGFAFNLPKTGTFLNAILIGSILSITAFAIWKLVKKI
ncbi:hypothetical protein HYS31_06060 [Candidatus Woesearchaeota archaeon]|nr:hypothetical protein [Candidatus Woesearchaeota archaeon]